MREITKLWYSNILFVAILFSCEPPQTDSYRELGSDVFEASFEDIFELLLDSIPAENASFFLDTISLEDDAMHLGPMNKVLDYIPEDWPLFLVSDMMSDFDLNQTSLNSKTLNLTQKVIVNPKTVKSLVESKDEKYFGMLRLSKFFYTSTRDKVIFFIGVYCGNQCSKSGIVYVRKTKKGEWRLDSVLEVWGSG